jgi:hypothetical protein
MCCATCEEHRVRCYRVPESAPISPRGHALGGVRGTYDRFAYIDEKRKAFEALAALIERIVHRPKTAVADLASARRKRRR